MNLFAKEKGIVLSVLNAVLLIWFLVAIIITISNFTVLIIKDHNYSYEEYEVTYCDFNYESKEDCKDNYVSYELEEKNLNIGQKRNIIISLSNVFLITGTIWLLNKDKKQNKQ